MSEKKFGKVKYFNKQRGFGFISTEGSDKDIFVHYTGIVDKGQGPRNLFEGDSVSFSVSEGRRGPQATEVETVS